METREDGVDRLTLAREGEVETPGELDRVAQRGVTRQVLVGEQPARQARGRVEQLLELTRALLPACRERKNCEVGFRHLSSGKAPPHRGAPL